MVMVYTMYNGRKSKKQNSRRRDIMSVKCWNCGEEAAIEDFLQELPNFITDFNKAQVEEDLKEHYKNNTSYRRVYCKKCFEVNENQKKQDLEEYLRLKSKIMFDRAIRMFEKQLILDIYEYEEAIKAVEEYAKENREKFMSSHEMLVAIILIHNEVQTKVQHKIRKYQVDFLLPELKVVLEIDGYMHDHSQIKDSRRDINLREELGKEWEIIRIPTKYIEANVILLPEAIKTLKDEKQKIRKQNGGVIPEWYSKREKKHYNKISPKEETQPNIFGLYNEKEI